MNKRDSVLTHLSDCSKIAKCQFNKSWVFVRTDIINAALELLKAQEPRVMTLEEVKALPDCVFLEDRDISNVHCTKTISRSALPQFVFVNTNGEKCIGFRGPDGDTSLVASRYGAEWRCWTSRPTDAQREATPWN